MIDPTPRLRTPGIIAAELNEPLSRILYVLRTHGHLIKPIGRAGTLRLYDHAAVALVRDVLALRGRKEVASAG